MSTPRRYPLYERLPEVHRTRDEEQGGRQLRAYLGGLEEVFGEIHRSIETLYHDLFVETAADWAVPYIGDLLGTSHLAGDPWTVRADVADSMALRRGKGTLGVLEQLVFVLTRWGARCVELREVLAWTQHLNHLRPDAGGEPPFALPGATRHAVVRGGTAPVRDPALLSLLGGAFDPFMRLPDVRPPAGGAPRANLPNLAVYLWRLQAYRVEVSPPVFVPAAPSAASTVARFLVHPMGDPVRLFNVSRPDADRLRGELARMDEVPGPLLRALLTTGSPAGAPARFVAMDPYDESLPGAGGVQLTDHALQLHVPGSSFAAGGWTFRGANLLQWEAGLALPLANREVAVDPENGRIAIAVATQAEVDALRDHLLLTWTYAAVGPVGAHPVSRGAPPAELAGEAADLRPVAWDPVVNRLQEALDGLNAATQPVVVEIRDNGVHDLDLAAVAGTLAEDGGPNLLLARSLVIRAGSGFRPVVRLAQPLRFRPAQVSAATAAAQAKLEAGMDRLTVRLEGVYVTRGPGFPAGEPLIARAALNALEVIDATLDPGGFRLCDGTRAAVHASLRLGVPYGFAAVADEVNFTQTPEIHVQRSLCGPLLADARYRLFLADSVVDAGAGADDAPSSAAFAVGGTLPGDPPHAAHGWGPPTVVSGATFLGRVRVERIEGRGGIFVHRLQARDDQHGCLRQSWLRGVKDAVPQSHACVRAAQAPLAFTDEAFGEPAYGQLAATADFRVRERGPGDDAMGAYGFLLEAHAWRNLQVRFREFMPVGVRPLLVPVT